MKSKADIFEQAIRDFGIEATLEYFDVPLLKKQDFRNQWKESESPSPLSGEEIKPFDSAGARVHFLLNLKKAQLMEYIYDFAWHYGRLYHIGDAEKIKEAIKEKFQLPEEFLYELLNRDQDAQASVATDSDSSTSDDTKNNSSNSGEQQTVAGELKTIAEYYWQNHRQKFSGINTGEYLDKEDWDKFIDTLASQPPTPEPAGELYWKQRCLAAEECYESLGTMAHNIHREIWQQLKNQKSEPQQNQDE